MTRFVITGCARSGTGYTAALFSRLGLKTEHETLFSPYTEAFEGFGDAPGESSWLAAPFIDQLPPGCVVLHQIRHPAEVIGSLLGLHFFDLNGPPVGRNLRSLTQVARARGLGGLSRRLLSGKWRGRGRRVRSDFVDFVERHCPEVLQGHDEAERCCRYWVLWNQLIEDQAQRADVVYKRYRIEDLDADLLLELTDLVGQPREREMVTAAIGELPLNVNTRPATTSESAPESGSSDLLNLAQGYGYAVDSA